MDDATPGFIYSLKQYFKGFIKNQVQAITDVSLNEVMIAMLKLEKNVYYGFYMPQPF